MRICLVIPCYNEAARLKLDAFVAPSSLAGELEWIFVDDGCTDDTARMLEQFAECPENRASVLRLPRNVGKGEAVRAGFARALSSDPDFVGFWDADLATPLDELPRLLAPLLGDPKLRLAIAARVRLLGRRIERRAARHYLGRIFATCASLTLRLPVYDTQCGAKLFRTDAEARAVFASPFHSRWLFDVEILARYCELFKAEGLAPSESMVEVPLRAWSDVRGSKLRFRDFAVAPWRLVEIHRQARRWARDRRRSDEN